MGLGCEKLFTPEDARAMQELVEEALGRPCPCKRGLVCPLAVEDAEEGAA